MDKAANTELLQYRKSEINAYEEQIQTFNQNFGLFQGVLLEVLLSFNAAFPCCLFISLSPAFRKQLYIYSKLLSDNYNKH